jgi:hypothetical protein
MTAPVIVQVAGSHAIGVTDVMPSRRLLEAGCKVPAIVHLVRDCAGWTVLSILHAFATRAEALTAACAVSLSDAGEVVLPADLPRDVRAQA